MRQVYFWGISSNKAERVAIYLAENQLYKF